MFEKISISIKIFEELWFFFENFEKKIDFCKKNSETFDFWQKFWKFRKISNLVKFSKKNSTLVKFSKNYDISRNFEKFQFKSNYRYWSKFLKIVVLFLKIRF